MRFLNYNIFILVVMIYSNQVFSDNASVIAEQTRKYFVGQGMLLHDKNLDYVAKEIQNVYSVKSIDKSPTCPVSRVINNPSHANSDKLNIFSVNFMNRYKNGCSGAPYQALCKAIRNNCTTVGTSIFCDNVYIKRQNTIAAYAYKSAYDGINRISTGKNAIFPPMNNQALTDLTRKVISLKNDEYTSALEATFKYHSNVIDFTNRTNSSVYTFSHDFASLVPLLHEVAHIEQSYCDRPAASQGKDDFVARLLLSGEHDYKKISEEHELLTCTTLSRNELDADIRSIDMLLRHLEKAAPKAIQNPFYAFTPETTAAEKEKVYKLVPYTREVALLTLMYGFEYEVLVHHDPEQALISLQSEPNGTSILDYTKHYMDAGMHSKIKTRGHMDPSFRMLQMSRVLNVKRMHQVNNGNSTSLVHLRLSPFTIARFLQMRRDICRIKDDIQREKTVSDYVMSAFQSVNQDPALDRARILLEGFLVPGANIRKLSLDLRPNRQDYYSIFTDDFAEKAFRHYDALWLAGEVVMSHSPGQTELLLKSVNSDLLVKYGESGPLPSGYKKIASKFKPGLTIYRWRFVEHGKRLGIAYDGLYYVNNHWVWLPKPYRIKR